MLLVVVTSCLFSLKEAYVISKIRYNWNLQVTACFFHKEAKALKELCCGTAGQKLSIFCLKGADLPNRLNMLLKKATVMLIFSISENMLYNYEAV